MTTNDTQSTPAASADTLLIIDALRKVADEQAANRAILVRMETRLVKLIQHLGAQKAIETRNQQETS